MTWLKDKTVRMRDTETFYSFPVEFWVLQPWRTMELPLRHIRGRIRPFEFANNLTNISV